VAFELESLSILCAHAVFCTEDMVLQVLLLWMLVHWFIGFGEIAELVSRSLGAPNPSRTSSLHRLLGWRWLTREIFAFLYGRSPVSSMDRSDLHLGHLALVLLLENRRARNAARRVRKD